LFTPTKGETKDGKEDAGYILSVLYNGKAETSEIVILKASDIAAGPITRIPLGMVVPHGLFGCFAATEEATWASDVIDRRAKLSNKMEARGAMWNEVKSDFSGLGLRFDDMEEYFGDFFN
jgi:all-trans-8'-apo-beta-carotenal 15,15'-oxygenase